MNLPLRIAPRWWALALLSLSPACAAPSTGPSPFAARAAAGDTVSLIQYYVRPDGRERFEQFVRESYWPAVQRVAQTDPERMRGFMQTRILYPIRANPDGTFTYVFLLDPQVSGGSYSILELLQSAYTADEGQQRYSRWAETWERARPFTSQVFVQSGLPDGATADSLARAASSGTTP